MINAFETSVFRTENNKICVQFVRRYTELEKLIGERATQSITWELTDSEFDQLVTSLCEFVEFEPEFGGVSFSVSSA